MFEQIEVLQIYDANTSDAAHRAVRLAAGLCAKSGATLYSLNETPEHLSQGFYAHAETVVDDLDTWLSETRPGKYRLVIHATTPSAAPIAGSVVSVEMEAWEGEATLYMASGIAGLLGDPQHPPIVPVAGHSAAHVIGYAIYCAAVGLAIKLCRGHGDETALVNGAGVLSWINWKSAIAAELGLVTKREGAQAEWPILKCKDGYAAFLFQERDWQQIVKLIGNPQLKDKKFASFAARAEYRQEYMNIISAWCESKTKSELMQCFLEYEIPGAPVLTLDDLYTDPLLNHRQSFRKQDNMQLIQPAERILRAEDTSEVRSLDNDKNTLPLAGFRVLDLGIITAGAGVSALLADMGAEVLKIESHDYPDPFRIWPGAGSKNGTESPVFKSNNRNKRGIALDLKTTKGRDAFFALAKNADIVVENFRRGVLQRLGIHFDALKAVNPSILMASVSGQGADGPGAWHTTFGSTLEASAGYASLVHYGDGAPFVSGRNLNFPDQVICLYGAAVIAQHAYDCRVKGVGKYIDVAQRDATIYLLGDLLAQQDCPPGKFFSGIFTSKDGVFVAISIPADMLPADDMTAWTRNQTAKELRGACHDLGGGACAEGDGNTILKQQSFWDNGVWTKSPAGFSVKGFPFQYQNSPMTISCEAPEVGADNSVFLSDHKRAE